MGGSSPLDHRTRLRSADCEHTQYMQTPSGCPVWGQVIECRRNGETWIELATGEVLQRSAPPEIRDQVDVGTSVLIDVDDSGEPVPWSTVTVTRES